MAFFFLSFRTLLYLRAPKQIHNKYNYSFMTANEIRESYKKFFESKGHAIVPSAPMVVKDDPTLMFTNAGMNQWLFVEQLFFYYTIDS